MKPSSRFAAEDGQLTDEFRGRVLSGPLLDRVAEVASLISDIGDPCWATSLTSAGMHIFDGIPLRKPYEALVLRGRNVRRIGHIIHTTTQLDAIDTEHVFGIPCLSPTRTLITIASVLDAPRLTTALDGALRDGLTSEDFLHRRIAALRTKGRYGIPRLLDVLDGNEVTRGGQSWLEREVLRLLAEAGVPKPATQATISKRSERLIRVDFWWPDTPVVVEALGYRWHRTGAQMSADAARLNELVLNGRLPMQFTYRQVVSSGASVVETIVRALAPFLGGELQLTA